MKNVAVYFCEDYFPKVFFFFFFFFFSVKTIEIFAAQPPK